MIRVDGLSKNYGDLEALIQLRFEVAKGENIGVLGLNGAGKSTLLRILAGELTPSAGRVVVGEVDLAEDPHGLRARVGYLPEGTPAYQEMRVRGFLRYMGLLRGMAARELHARIEEVAELTHIKDHLERVVGELSLGYRKRVGIAQAILHRPAVVILDEPVSALDPAEIVGMRGLIRQLGGSHTVVVSSHILSEVHETCDRILVLHHGRLVAEGSEANLASHLGVSSDARHELVVRGDEARLREAAGPGARIEVLAPLGEGLVRVVVALDGAGPEALVARLVGAGLGVRRVAAQHTDLESVFLSLIQEAGS
jgi:ABC-2 type transport system ATP-binding protein